MPKVKVKVPETKKQGKNPAKKSSAKKTEDFHKLYNKLIDDSVKRKEKKAKIRRELEELGLLQPKRVIVTKKFVYINLMSFLVVGVLMGGLIGLFQHSQAGETNGAEASETEQTDEDNLYQSEEEPLENLDK